MLTFYHNMREKEKSIVVDYRSRCFLICRLNSQYFLFQQAAYTLDRCFHLIGCSAPDMIPGSD